MHSHFTVVFDACVLYPATLRNLLIQLATTSLFRARWTDDIREEWTRALRRDKPDITVEQATRLNVLMERAVPDCLVTGYEPLIAGLSLPDADDRHVLAAAIRCHAAVIVTTNTRDFPSASLVPFGVTPQHPDEFITHLLDLDAGAVCNALRMVRARLRKPPRSVEELLDLLQRQGLPETVSVLQGFGDLL
jgi:hypothetical protein